MGISKISTPQRTGQLSDLSFICAMDWEAACLPSSAKVYIAGIGPERAKQAARQAIAEGAKNLISFGSAGGLSPQLSCGDVVISETVHGVKHLPDEAQADSLCTFIYSQLSDLKPRSGKVYSCQSILNTCHEKKQAYEASGALVVDMESAAIKIVADQHQCAFAAVRVVLDDAQSVMPQPLVQACDEFGRVQPLNMAKTVLTNPSLWSQLGPLAKAQKKVQAVLKTAGQQLATL